MRLADFIESALQEVLAEWEAVAATRLPLAAKMDALALRDHAPQILRAIAADLRQPQTETERAAKSHGLAASVHGALHTAAEVHGALRAEDGYAMSQLLSEYRGLRASVLRLWTNANGALSEATAADDVMRFNEAVDQAVHESVNFFIQQRSLERIAPAAADRALARNHARLGYATRLSRVGFWYCDLPFDVLEWDEQVKEHFFFEPSARIKIEDFYDRIHPEDRESTRVAIEAAISDRSAYDIVYRTRDPATGEVKWIRALGGTDYASDGTPIYFDGITVDVTAQKSEEERVAESEARHRGVLANMDEAFTLFDQDFNIIDVNDAACRLIDAGRTELIGASHWQLFPGTYDSELGRMYRQIQLDGEPRYLEHRYEFADGRQRWFEARAFTVGLCVAVLFRDVTDRREMIETLKGVDRRKDEFIAILAHELRNPLAPIRTAVRVLGAVDASAADLKQSREVIDRQVKTMARLLDDLLDVSRIKQRKLELRKETVLLWTVLGNAIETSRPLIDAHQHKLSVALPDEPIPMRVDPVRLGQVVTNLLNNSAKYSPPGAQIDLVVTADPGTVRISVKDSGVGMTRDSLAHIFELFSQVETSLPVAEGGLGIGLSLAKGLVELHGGQLAASSDGLGTGCTFTITLPREQISMVMSSNEKADATPLRRRRVLVADDNRDGADSLALLLSLEGHEVHVAYTGGEALAIAVAQPPEIAFLDVGMPDIDGYELARRLRSVPFNCRPTLVAVTGWGRPDDVRRAMEAGFDHHVTKPLDPDVLPALFRDPI
jgi:PAS domain S-box-containing protein